MAPPADRARFRAAFNRLSRRVRARLAARRALTGAAIGLVLGAGASAAAWQTRHGALRPLAASFGVLGAAIGLAVARRKRWRDGDVALYLDARLAADEAIATAVDLEHREDDAARAVVLSDAVRALHGATSKKVRAPFLGPWHALVPLAAAAIAYVSWMPLPPAPQPKVANPGVDKVQVAELAGLEKIIALGQANARDEAQRERLKKIAEDARKLRDKLKDGVEKREALADLAKLKDEITAERLSLGDGEERQGLESALGKMGEDPDLKKAQKALGDRDLVDFDDEMEKLANRLEKNDRERAEKILEDAAEEAKKNGGKNVSKALEDAKKKLADKGDKADALKELAKELGDGLGDDGKKALGDLKNSGDPKDAKKLEEKMNDALKKLSPEQRKKLAENMKKRMAEGDGAKSPSKKKLKDLADKLDTPEGQQELEDELKKMAEDDPKSDGAEGQQKLDDAEEGADEAEGQLGGAPMPLPMQDGKPGPNQGGKKPDKPSDDPATPGHSDDPPGVADHHGQTAKVEGGGLKSKANAKVNKAKSMPGMVMGRTAGKAGETANMQGTGALGNAGPDEVDGIERSDVPEEYREQVGRYFQPK